MPETETVYKVLDGHQACHGGRAVWRTGQWKTVRGELVPCQNGLHLCRRQDLVRWLGPTIWLAEHDGTETVVDGTKIVVRRARILERTPWDDRIARLFAADCAEHVLPIYEKQHPDDDRPRKAIEAARAYANGTLSHKDLAAARNAARNAAGDAARVAGNAARDAGDAAGDAARVAGNAAWAAAGDVAWEVARVAAWSAERKWQTDRLFDYLEGRINA